MPYGFAGGRLARIGRHVDSYVAAGKLPGALCLVSRGGEEAYYHASGYRDVERERLYQRDTVVRFYSMTKPITSVALMMLYEEGCFQLDDPVGKHIESWAGLEVFKDDGESETSPAPMTIKHLLTHTSGLTYGFSGTHPVDAMYAKANLTGGSSTLADMVNRLAGMPLKFAPGTKWNYGVSTDICGHLVEHFSGQKLDEFVQERITGPLLMADAGFQVRDGAGDRFAACYSHEAGGYKLQDDPEGSRYHRRPTFFSGGGGMVGTIDDYHRFATMLLRKGALDDVRILGRKTVEYMTSNHLPGNCDLAAMGQPVFTETSYDGIGFGLGFSVVVDPAAANVLDSPGEFAWGGAASTYFWVDPVEEVIAVFLTQLLPSSTYPIRRELKTLVYQALV